MNKTLCFQRSPAIPPLLLSPPARLSVPEEEPTAEQAYALLRKLVIYFRYGQHCIPSDQSAIWLGIGRISRLIGAPSWLVQQIVDDEPAETTIEALRKRFRRRLSKRHLNFLGDPKVLADWRPYPLEARR